MSPHILFFQSAYTIRIELSGHHHQYLVDMFYRSLFVLLFFIFWPLCCLFFFDLRIMITTFASNSFHYYNTSVGSFNNNKIRNATILTFIWDPFSHYEHDGNKLFGNLCGILQ